MQICFKGTMVEAVCMLFDVDNGQVKKMDGFHLKSYCSENTVCLSDGSNH